MENIEQIKAQSEVINANLAAHIEAKEAVVNAERDLLLSLVPMLLKNFRALASKIKTRACYNPKDIENEFEYYDETGICLTALKPCPDSKKTSQWSGKYVGEDWYLLKSGKVLQACYSGTWSSYADSVDEWTSETTERTVEELASEWKTEELVEVIVERINQEANGERSKRTEQLKAKAAKLNAVLALLK